MPHDRAVPTMTNAELDAAINSTTWRLQSADFFGHTLTANTLRAHLEVLLSEQRIRAASTKGV